ncbi:MAG: T9SS C-terminal target domain-containing protein [Flavobacteriia bacterium]|nr:T9SS C-terminal target domain-containing protein [Flavobacteriia bacterium]
MQFNPSLRFLVLSILLNLFGGLKAQFQFIYNDSIPVQKLGHTLKYPWAGGLNFPQFSELDYDFDGDMDLVILDRSNDQIRVFEHVLQGASHTYRFNPYGSALFPNDVRYRMYLGDYNLDGKNDLFTYGIGGVKVYRNAGSAGSGLQWVLEKNLVYSDYNGMTMGLYISSADIPAIVDVDGDQDLDILTYSIAGDHVEYHKNLSKELYGHCDSLVYSLKNRCWGGFIEAVTSNAISLNSNSTLCTTGNVPNPEIPVIIKPEEEEKAHSGSTLLALDFDNNHVLDLLIGDVAYGNMNKLMNGGTNPNTNSLMISVDPAFPSNTVPLNLQLFPGAFYLDVDFDGKKDIICSPNARGTSENEHSVWKYKNQGTTTLPNFIYETNAFLQEDMIEHGIGSVPVLVDVTGDSLPDLFVANYFAYKPTLLQETRMAYYKNTGTANHPVFTFVDEDFLNLSQTVSGLRVLPTFGDLNGDGKPDLILGLENGTLMYYQNNSTNSNPTFSAPMANYAGIDVGQVAAPQLFDIDLDGLLDLIVGEKTGTLAYYKNQGTPLVPNFVINSVQLGGIDIQTATPDGFPLPHFFRWHDTTYLLVGGYDGILRFYDSIDQHVLDTFHLRSAPFLGIDVGTFSAAWVADVDHDQQLDLYVGQDLGGVFRLEHMQGANLAVEEPTLAQLTIYPNPTETTLNLRGTSILGKIQVYSIDGKLSFEMKADTAEVSLNVATLQQGVYTVFIAEKFRLKFIKN